MTPQTMQQTARLRGKTESASVCWTAMVPGYTVYGRPGYWRIVDNSVPVGTKAGGFVKSPSVKTLLDERYFGKSALADSRTSLIEQMATEDFFKETVR